MHTDIVSIHMRMIRLTHRQTKTQDERVEYPETVTAQIAA